MIYRFGAYELDTDAHALRSGDEAVAVEPQVFALLCLLVENRERALSKDEIFEKVWDGRIVSDAALSSRVKSARQAVGDDGQSQSVIQTVRGHGFRFVAEVTIPEAAAATKLVVVGADEAPTDAGRPSRPIVAVLPFHWLGDPGPKPVLADALAHELIGSLSRLRWLGVIARGSSFRFSNPNLDLIEVGRVLGAGYCTTGLIEVHGEELALTAELIDTRDGQLVWSERIPFRTADADAVRAELVARIVAALELRIPEREAERARSAQTASLDAWAEYHLGLQAMYRFNRGDNSAATSHFERSIALDPNFARAHAGLSFTRFQDAFLDYTPDKAAARDDARRHAERGIELDSYDTLTNFVMGRAFWLIGDVEKSLGWLDRSVELSPSFAQGLYAKAWAHTIAGRGLVGREVVDSAMRLSPLDPLMYAMLGTRSLSHIAQGEFEQAAQWADRGAAAPGAHVLISVIAVAAHELAGNPQTATRWAEDVRSRRPDVSRALFFQSFPFVSSEMHGAVDAALAKHGF